MAFKLTGGELVCRTLHHLRAPAWIYSVSGNQILPIYDAFPDFALCILHMRHESAAAFAAAGMSEMSGKPGVVLTSAGPGFLAALTGVASVRAMELPILFLSGASPVRNSGYGNFQELDQAAICRNVCKGSFKVEAADAIPSVLQDAWSLSQSGIPGPVHVALPADVLLATREYDGLPKTTIPIATSRSSCEARGGPMQRIAEYLMDASRPVVIARPSAARGEASELLGRLARRLGVQPVITGPPRGLADSKYAHLAPHYKRSDCALIIAPSDYALGFLDESVVAPDGQILLIDDEGDPPPRRNPAVHAQVPVVDALKFLLEATEKFEAKDPDWSRLWLAPPPAEARPHPHDGPVHPLEVAAQVREILKPNDVLVVDGGEFCQWIRLGLADVPNRWLWNGKFGVIGNALPMAIGVASTNHDGRTIAIMGDGGAGYHFLEFETAARIGIPLIAIIGNDARWSAEWHIQVSRYGSKRTFETSLLPARYDQAAAGLGAVGFHAPDSHTPAVSSACGCATIRPTTVLYQRHHPVAAKSCRSTVIFDSELVTVHQP